MLNPNPDALWAGVLRFAAWLSVLLWAYMQIDFLWSTFPDDLSAVYMAGWLYGIGHADLVYAVPDGFFGKSPETWAPYLETLGVPQEYFVTPFVYPPLWAALASVITQHFDMVSFFRVSAILLVVCLALSMWLAWRIARSTSLSLPVWLLLSCLLLGTSSVSTYALGLLQPQIVVVFLCLLSFERYRSDCVISAGICLALAASMKISPAALAIVFVMDRNWRALGVFAICCAIAGVLSWSLAGTGMHLAFLNSLREFGAGVLITFSNWSIQASIYGVLAFAGSIPETDLARRSFLIPNKLQIVTIITILLATIALAWCYRRTARLSREPRLTVRLLGVSMLVPLFGPIGWCHYYLLPFLLLPALIGLLPLRLGGAVIVSTGVFLSQVGMMWGLRTFDSGLSLMLPATAVMGVLFVLCVGAPTSRRNVDRLEALSARSVQDPQVTGRPLGV